MTCGEAKVPPKPFCSRAPKPKPRPSLPEQRTPSPPTYITCMSTVLSFCSQHNSPDRRHDTMLDHSCILRGRLLGVSRPDLPNVHHVHTFASRPRPPQVTFNFERWDNSFPGRPEKTPKDGELLLQHERIHSSSCGISAVKANVGRLSSTTYVLRYYARTRVAWMPMCRLAFS